MSQLLISRELLQSVLLPGQGTPLPKALGAPASLPYDDSFLILGGKDNGRSCQDSIYQVVILTVLKTKNLDMEALLQ